jgi:GntR family transcriptional regulator
MINGTPVKPASAAGSRRAAPRHRSIADSLRKNIREGRYKVGSQLPTEEQLCEIFRASRPTLREALRSLTEDGLIVRRRRSGSTVVASQSPTVLAHMVASIEGLLNYPTETFRKTIETKYIDADCELASRLKCSPGATWFHIAALRYPKAIDVPLCWTDMYIMPKYASVVRHRAHETLMVADQITEMFGEVASRIQIEVASGVIPARVARALRVKAGSSALNVVRRYTGQSGEVFETTFSIHPAERFTYQVELRRERTLPSAVRSRSEAV